MALVQGWAVQIAMGACAWDDTEFVLKASLKESEMPLLHDWVAGYRANMPCFPRLHIVTSNASFDAARKIFRAVPNVSLVANNYPRNVYAAGTFVYMQWPSTKLQPTPRTANLDELSHTSGCAAQSCG